MRRSAIVCFVLGITFTAGCGDDAAPPAALTCTPQCRTGYVCAAGVCVLPCNPPCGPSQACVVDSGVASCESPMMLTDAATDRDDAAVTPGDVVSDQTAPDVTVDVADLDVVAPTDVAPIDAPPDDTALPDAPPIDTLVSDVSPIDTGPTDTSPMDTGPRDTGPLDSGPRDTGPMDAGPVDSGPIDSGPRDTGPVDVGDSGARPPCGMAGLPCCQGRACIGASVCDSAMRCVAFTPAAGECTSTLSCAGGDTCGGIFICGERACLLCVTPGARALGAACTTADQCASVYCINGACTAPCTVGPMGAASCRAVDPRTICAQFTSRPRTDGGTGPTSTFGGCVRSCTRNADCASGQVCRLQRNDYVDGLDQVCAGPSGMLAPGASCDPDPPAGATTAAFCDNGQCVGTGAHTGFCAPFCASDADCPSSAYACIGFNFLRPSGSVQVIRMCTRR